MISAEQELQKSGINVICPINTINVNEIATYVSRLLCSKFPNFNLNYNDMFTRISRMNMYIADMPSGMSDACYFYRNENLYFRKGLSFDEIKKLSFHEIVHHFQEIKDSNGVLHKLGLCTYLKVKTYGLALNEASVQLMSSFANDEKLDTVTYYGITFPTNSPSYYPLLCNLVKQIGYLTGFSVLFESTFFANSAFFNKFKFLFGEKNAFKIQQNFDKLLYIEEKIINLNNKIQTKDMSYMKFKNATDTINKYKNQIKKTFLDTQNLILTSYFNARADEIRTANEIYEFRKTLYSYSNLIGTADNYTFFNDYYINKMVEIDRKYEAVIENKNSLAVVKKSKLSIILNAIKKIFVNENVEFQDSRNI